MVVREIIETICEYDTDGNLIRKVVTETHEEDDNDYQPLPSCSGGCGCHS
jgi:hypothetical protein